MDELERHRSLVRKALRSGLRNCIDWQSRLKERVRSDASLRSLTPEFIIDSLLECGQRDTEIKQAKATTDGCDVEYEYLFAVLIPVDDLPRPLYVKVAICDDDPDVPSVIIVSCHVSSC